MPKLRAEMSSTELLGLGVRPVGQCVEGDTTLISVEEFRCAVARAQGAPCVGCYSNGPYPPRKSARPQVRWVDCPDDRPRALVLTVLELTPPTDGSCPGYDRTRPAWRHGRYHMTLRAAEAAALAMMRDSATEVATRFGMHPGTALALFRDVAKELDKLPAPPVPKRIGLDGVHRGKQTWTTIADLTQGSGQIWELLETHNSEKLEAIMATWPGRDEVEVVVIDPAPKLYCLVKKLFPNAVVVVDKRHVQAKALKRAHRVRVLFDDDEEWEADSDEAPAYKSLKRAMETRREKLTEAQKRLLAKAGPEIAEAYDAKEAFYDLYLCNRPSDAAAALNAWWTGLSARIRPHFKPLYKLVGPKGVWHEPFLAYFRVMPRITTAYVESANRIIRAIDADHRNRLSFAHIRIKLFHRLGRISNDDVRNAVRTTSKAHQKGDHHGQH